MTHVMVPDGVFPWWLSGGGWVLAVALLAFATWRLRVVPVARMVPLVGVMTALMFVIMSFELIPIGYELHFTTLTGMVIGPWYGAIAALLFNAMRAMIGDGAFTNIGLNTVITWTEIALGAVFFAALRPLARRRSPALAAGVTTFATLFLATLVFVGVVALSRVNPAEAIHTGAYDVEAGGFRDAALAEGVVGLKGAEGHGTGEQHGDENVGLGRFVVAMLVLGFFGWTIEAVLVGAIVSFISRVRPELLGLGRA